MLPAPPEAVWDMLPALLGDDVELTAEPGGRLRVRGPEGDHVGVVDEAEAPRRLVFWWVPTVGDDAPSKVELDLSANEAGTLLHVRETRFDAAEAVAGLHRGPLALARS